MKSFKNRTAKLLLTASIMLVFAVPVFSAKIPDNVQQFISNDFPNTTFRFDGVIILPDNTIYLPLFPAKIL